MVQILLMLKVLFTQDFKVDLFHGSSTGSEPILFLSSNLFSFVLETVQNDFQHNFTWLTNDADGSVVLAEL